MKASLLLMLLLSASARAATTQPATTQSLEQQLAQHKLEEQKTYLNQLKDTPELKLPTGAITDIFELTVEKDMLVVRPKLTGNNDQQRCTVKGIEGQCIVMVAADRAGNLVPNGGANGGPNALQFMHRDFTNPQEIFRHTMLFAHNSGVQLSMDLDGLVRSKSVSLIEDNSSEDPEQAVRLTAQVIDAVTDQTLGSYTLSAPTFRELRKRYPRETQEFIVPILRDLQAQHVLAPDPQIISQVLQTEVKPDPELTKKLETVLKKFDSDSFQEREQASKDLAALGQPAATALARADRKGWSIDRESGVDAFLSQLKAMSAQDVNKLGEDPLFLIDCMYSDDRSIRNAATKKFETVTKLYIAPDATGPNRDEMIDRAFSRLYPPLATQPATQPSP